MVKVGKYYYTPYFSSNAEVQKFVEQSIVCASQGRASSESINTAADVSTDTTTSKITFPLTLTAQVRSSQSPTLNLATSKPLEIWKNVNSQWSLLSVTEDPKATSDVFFSRVQLSNSNLAGISIANAGVYAIKLNYNNQKSACFKVNVNSTSIDILDSGLCPSNFPQSDMISVVW